MTNRDKIYLQESRTNSICPQQERKSGRKRTAFLFFSLKALMLSVNIAAFFFFLVLHVPSFSVLASLQRQFTHRKHFLRKKAKICFLWAKADNSVVWHNYKRSIFGDLKEMEDFFSYLRSRVCYRTVTNFPQLQ